jgi:exodeoxyribonuclease V beta subunit
MGEPAPFDICGSLPGPGVTVLEASAGTGKTFAITALITRFVAEGVPLDAILAVTFTRMATGELRDRVRRQLVTADDLLRRHLAAGESVPDDEPIVAHLSKGARPDVEARQAHLADAVAAFDAATIATTHGFCRLVLDGLGSAGDVPAGATLLEDPADLIDEVVDDLYLRWALRHGWTPAFKREDARLAVSEAVRNPGVALAPEPGDNPAGLLRRLVETAAGEVARRLQDDNLLTYDQVLARLAGTLEHPQRGPVAGDRLRQRYRVVLVDEFQDTDPIQWRVLQEAFGGGETTLVLVGDPKQAIYSFRGADVRAYLDAARDAARFTLGVNWRADQLLLDATEALFNPLQMGDEAIRFRSVNAPADRARSAMEDFPAQAPIRLRLVSNNQPGLPKTAAKGLLHKPSLVDWIARDVARDVARLLGSGARIGGKALKPADLAVLTRTNKQSACVRDALRAAGVPAVIAGLDSVFASEAAGYWLRLLEALEEPASRSRAVAVALTPWVGMTAAEAATADERVWETVHARIHRWSAILASYGVAALYRSITATEGLPARVVATPGGERDLTDLGHVAEVLHAESTSAQMGVPTLRSWLARRIAEVGVDEAGAEERTRRLDSDAEAVQVLTVHRAKGLEFGVVYCPYLWDAALGGRASGPVIFHDGQRTLDVGCPERSGPARAQYEGHCRMARAEEQGEELRLMYVALTRARHQLVLWWGRADQCRHSPLGRLLMCRDPSTGAVGETRARDPSDDEMRRALGALLDRTAPGLIATEAASDAGAAEAGAGEPAAPAATLEAARFDRVLDLRWRRASYTSITAQAADSLAKGVTSEPEHPGVEDEPGGQEVLPAPAPAAEPVECPLADLPKGAEFGTFVHRVMEQTDFTAPDFSAAAGTLATDVDLEVLASGLTAVLATPLAPLLPDLVLGHLSRRDRVDEMRFELPLVGGDQPSGQLSTSAIASLLARHLPAGGPLSGYPSRLADPLLASELRGYLTGSLDLVFRHRAADGVTRWYVADYKTNWLGPTANDYRPDVLDLEMQRHHYPLQALLYLVALHRYLRWRVAGYSPDQHLGGVLYFFLRGMVGPNTPVVEGETCGVFSWAPPASLVVELSDLFATGSGRE